MLGEDQLELAKWVQGAYGCLLVEALRLMVPAQLRGGRVREKQIRMVYVPETVDVEAALASFQKKDGTLRAPKQHEILELVSHYAEGISVGDIYGFIPWQRRGGKGSAGQRAFARKRLYGLSFPLWEQAVGTGCA